MSNEQEILAFLANTKMRSEKLISQPHIGADVKAVIIDLIQVCDSFKDLMDFYSGTSADKKLQNRKLEQAKWEARTLENKLNKCKVHILRLATDSELVLRESTAIAKRHPDPQDPDQVSASRIKSSAATIVASVGDMLKIYSSKFGG